MTVLGVPSLSVTNALIAVAGHKDEIDTPKWTFYQDTSVCKFQQTVYHQISIVGFSQIEGSFTATWNGNKKFFSSHVTKSSKQLTSRAANYFKIDTFIYRIYDKMSLPMVSIGMNISST
jgi:hypothetical protein